MPLVSSSTFRLLFSPFLFFCVSVSLFVARDVYLATFFRVPFTLRVSNVARCCHWSIVDRREIDHETIGDEKVAWVRFLWLGKQKCARRASQWRKRWGEKTSGVKAGIVIFQSDENGWRRDVYWIWFLQGNHAALTPLEDMSAGRGQAGGGPPPNCQKVFIQRDYSEGTMVKFQTQFPTELESRVCTWKKFHFHVSRLHSWLSPFSLLNCKENVISDLPHWQCKFHSTDLSCFLSSSISRQGQQLRKHIPSVILPFHERVSRHWHTNLHHIYGICICFRLTHQSASHLWNMYLFLNLAGQTVVRVHDHSVEQLLRRSWTSQLFHVLRRLPRLPHWLFNLHMYRDSLREVSTKSGEVC